MAHFDIGRSPIQKELFERRREPAIQRYFALAVAKRPARELYDLRKDPDQLNNVADAPDYAPIAEEMERKLMETLRRTGDLRVGNDPDQWEDYPRLEGKMRRFPPPEQVRD